MSPEQAMVREFQEKVVGGATSPAPPELRDAALKARLIAEEAAETVAALVGPAGARELLRDWAERAALMRGPGVADAVDGLCDLIYVAYGAAEAIGVDLAPFFALVHETNMKKTGELVDGSGKRGRKPPGWEPPRIAEMLDALTRRDR